ncbi:hypothetical protein Hanom_Chr04g00315961 [Helianthus anomalus]
MIVISSSRATNLKNTDLKMRTLTHVFHQIVGMQRLIQCTNIEFDSSKPHSHKFKQESS